MRRPTLILAKGNVPFYEILNSYKWVDAFIKSENLKSQLDKLRKEESEIKQIPCDAGDVLAAIRQSFKAHQDRQIEELKIFIEKHWEHTDLLKQLVSDSEAPYSGFNVTQVPDLRLFEAALKQIKTPDKTIKNKKREAILDKIASKIAGLKVDLSELSPSKFFMKWKGGMILDIRTAFVEHWMSYQAQVNGPCNPRGIVLEYCEPVEQAAWHKLNLKQYVDPEAQFSPNPN